MTILQTSIASLAEAISAKTDSVNMADLSKEKLAMVAEKMVENPHDFLSSMLNSAIVFGLKVLAAIVVYLVGAWLIRKIKKMVATALERKKAEKTLSSFILSVTSITLTLLLLITTISTLGVNTTSLAALLASAGVAIGMALSGTMQNFAGGLIILLFKPFKVGDYIKIQTYEGFVSDVTIVSTKLRTADNREVIIPNSELISNKLENQFSRELRRVEWKVGVEYNSPSDKVIGVLTNIVKADARILDSSTNGASDPSIYLSELKDSSVEYTVRAWVMSGDYWNVYFTINKAIYDELPKNEIKFPFPQVDVHLSNT